MRCVILESPYAGNTDANIIYARACVRDSIDRGESPLASHLLYPQILNDADPDQRQLGIACGLAWLSHADAVIAYIDFGISSGMVAAIEAAEARESWWNFGPLAFPKLLPGARTRCCPVPLAPACDLGVGLLPFALEDSPCRTQSRLPRQPPGRHRPILKI